MLDYYNNLAPNTFGSRTGTLPTACCWRAEFFAARSAPDPETLGLVQVCFIPSWPTSPANPWPGPRTWMPSLGVPTCVLLDSLRPRKHHPEHQRTLAATDRRTHSPQMGNCAGLGEKPEKACRAALVRGRRSIPLNGTQSRAIPAALQGVQLVDRGPSGPDRSILSEATAVLTQQGKAAVISSGDGLSLDLKDLSFRLPETVYQCPVSRRFIDTRSEQLNPYTPRTDREMVRQGDALHSAASRRGAPCMCRVMRACRRSATG